MTEQVRMTNKAREAARRLAVAYAAYMEYRQNDQLASAVVWAGILMQAQEETGITMVSPSNLQWAIDYGSAKTARAA